MEDNRSKYCLDLDLDLEIHLPASPIVLQRRTSGNGRIPLTKRLVIELKNLRIESVHEIPQNDCGIIFFRENLI